MPSNRCHYESSDESCESSDENSCECNHRHCEKKKYKKPCCEKEKHKKCSKNSSKNNRCCKKKHKCSSSRNNQKAIDYCKNDCQDGKVILITIS